MAEVTAFTAERSQAIEDGAITDAHLDGYDLVLTPTGFATNPGTYPEINVGNVRGEVGPQGPAAPEQPSGMITMFGGVAAPSGYLLCQGQAVSRVTYATLFGVVGTAFGVGDGSTTFNLPDLRSKFPVGLGTVGFSDALGETGGSKDSVVVAHTHTGPSHTHTGPSHTHTGPNHAHSIDHDHGSANTSTNGSHSHTITDDATSGDSRFIPTGSGENIQYRTSAYGQADNTGTTGDHQHSLDLPPFAGTSGYSGTGVTGASGTGLTGASGTDPTGETGESAVDKNLPPYVVMNFIIKT